MRRTALVLCGLLLMVALAGCSSAEQPSGSQAVTSPSLSEEEQVQASSDNTGYKEVPAIKGLSLSDVVRQAEDMGLNEVELEVYSAIAENEFATSFKRFESDEFYVEVVINSKEEVVFLFCASQANTANTQNDEKTSEFLSGFVKLVVAGEEYNSVMDMLARVPNNAQGTAINGVTIVAYEDELGNIVLQFSAKEYSDYLSWSVGK
ncbi:MAG: hypothetical protein ACK5JF_09055 [Oscillospiraceae bacterium]